MTVIDCVNRKHHKQKTQATNLFGWTFLRHNWIPVTFLILPYSHYYSSKVKRQSLKLSLADSKLYNLDDFGEKGGTEQICNSQIIITRNTQIVISHCVQMWCDGVEKPLRDSTPPDRLIYQFGYVFYLFYVNLRVTSNHSFQQNILSMHNVLIYLHIYTASYGDAYFSNYI